MSAEVGRLSTRTSWRSGMPACGSDLSCLLMQHRPYPWPDRRTGCDESEERLDLGKVVEFAARQVDDGKTRERLLGRLDRFFGCKELITNAASLQTKVLKMRQLLKKLDRYRTTDVVVSEVECLETRRQANGG